MLVDSNILLFEKFVHSIGIVRNGNRTWMVKITNNQIGTKISTEIITLSGF